MKKISKVWYLVVALVVLGVAAYFLGKPDTKETISFDTAYRRADEHPEQQSLPRVPSNRSRR